MIFFFKKKVHKKITKYVFPCAAPLYCGEITFKHLFIKTKENFLKPSIARN